MAQVVDIDMNEDASGNKGDGAGKVGEEPSAMEVDTRTQPEPPTSEQSPIEAEEPSRNITYKPGAPPVDATTTRPTPPGKKGRNVVKTGKSRTGGALTMSDISQDALTRLADETWSLRAKSTGAAPAFDPALVARIYSEELGGGSSAPFPRRVALLELSQYLENYLCPSFDAAVSTTEHVLSIVLMVNEKFKEGLPPWNTFDTSKVRKRFKFYSKATFMGILLICFKLSL